MRLPAFKNKWLRPFETPWIALPTSPSVYEWARSHLGLIPLRRNCSMPCWMSDAAWTEWRSYSRPRYNYVAWLPESTPHSIFKSATLGTRSLSASATAQYETSIRAQKNVKQLRISKSLTCADLNERLTSTPVFAMRRWTRSDYGFAALATYGRMSWQYCARGNGKRASIDDWLVSKRDIFYV